MRSGAAIEDQARLLAISDPGCLVAAHGGEATSSDVAKEVPMLPRTARMTTYIYRLRDPARSAAGAVRRARQRRGSAHGARGRSCCARPGHRRPAGHPVDPASAEGRRPVYRLHRRRRAAVRRRWWRAGRCVPQARRHQPVRLYAGQAGHVQAALRLLYLDPQGDGAGYEFAKEDDYALPFSGAAVYRSGKP